MGDSGAFLLGLLMAVSTSLVGGRADPNTQDFVGQTFFFFAPLAIPLLILGVPILDTLFAIVRRASKRQALDVADKGHLHHRLMNLGHGHRRSVLILWTWTALLSGVRAVSGVDRREPELPAASASARSGSCCSPCCIRACAASAPRRSRRRSTGRPSEQIDPRRPERRESEAPDHGPECRRRPDGEPDGERGSGPRFGGGSGRFCVERNLELRGTRRRVACACVHKRRRRADVRAWCDPTAS